ncbi:MAG: permease, partial [Candidatus Muiribacteriaceae bacterium]
MDRFILFVINTISIFFEASPFLLIGASLAAGIELFISDDFFERHMPSNRFLAILYGITIGLIIPSCECGIVPVTGKLLNKGVSVPAALSYMMCAPVINPVVILATYTAFPGGIKIVLTRVIIVILSGITVSLLLSGKDIVRKDGSVGHSHGCSCGHCSNLTDETDSDNTFLRFIDHVRREFITTGRFLFMGAAIASAFKTYIGNNALDNMTDGIMAIVSMMVLAFVLSVCSEADAFVARSFSR